ncbi:MAG: hypothetical protein NTY50_06240 [Methylobacter sp.]|nr:hypothetical protein [Methylobacter sp.]
MSFFKNYGIEKAKSLASALSEAIVRFDPEGATEAAIGEIEEKFDNLNVAFSKAKQVWDKENKEAETILALYNQRLAAADYLQADPGKTAALNQLISALEEMLPDIEREKQEADDARQDMDQLDGLVKQYAEKLKSARHTVEKAKKDMQRAEFQKERAKEIADAAAMAAGLSKSTTGLSSALDHMNKLAEQSKAEADAANRKARLLQPTSIDEDADIKAAMAAVSGNSPAGLSIQDRMAALRSKV